MTTTTTTRTRSRHETVTRFLAALSGPRDGGELLELRYRLDDGQRMGQLFDHPTRLSGLATRAVALGRRTDVYVGCAPRTRRHGARNDVERAFVLWVDCDGEAAVEALSHFDPQPSIVIASGTGNNCHAYWPLTEPLAADEVERANRRLAHALGADGASADPASGEGRHYVIERELGTMAELEAIVTDYLQQAETWDAIPAAGPCSLLAELQEQSG
jgi:hypothetical protein